jgi:transposase-like protein
MKTRKYHKCTQEEKLEVVRLYEEGYGTTKISREKDISIDQIEFWLRRYRELGLSGLKKLHNPRLSDKSKAKIICQIRNKYLSLQEASIAYGVSETALWRWQKDFLFDGTLMLTPVSKSGCSNKVMGRPKKKPPQTELEKLQVEILELRAEIAYLKKVRALVEQRENCVAAIVPKPSKN